MGTTSNKLQQILYNYQDEEILKADGFDEAVIGICTNSMRLIYSVQKCHDILRREMSYEDAVEHFSYNVSGSCVGEKTPIWMDDTFFVADYDLSKSGLSPTPIEKSSHTYK